MNYPPQNRSRSVVSRNSFNPDDGWEFAPSGDPALTRRLMAAATDYWVVKRKLGRSAAFAKLHGHCGISPHEAKTVITHKQRNALLHLLDFRFKRNPRHNWSAQRLTMVERMVSEQAKELVG